MTPQRTDTGTAPPGFPPFPPHRPPDRWLSALSALCGGAVVAVSAEGEVCSWCPAAARVFGMGAGDALGEPLARLFVTECRGEVARTLADLRSGGPVEREWVVSRGGARRSVLARVAAAEPGGLRLLLVRESAGLPQPPLTPREREVLGLLANAMHNREIAAALFIAERTVKAHVEHILPKLGVSDRLQAAVWAARHDLAPAPRAGD